MEGADLVKPALAPHSGRGSRKLTTPHKAHRGPKIARLYHWPSLNSLRFQDAKPPINIKHFRMVKPFRVTADNVILAPNVTCTPTVFVAEHTQEDRSATPVKGVNHRRM